MWFIAVISFVLGYIALLLIGSFECFQGTFVERWHYALTDGVCDLLELTINKLFGQRGNACLESTAAACCHGSNPIGQLFFAILFIGCYLGAYLEVFPYIDGVRISTWHKYFGTAIAVLVLLFFLLVSFGDPGLITDSDIRAHLVLYPPDGALFPMTPRECSTCGRLKPARSKHCNATKGCVARFDHWCIWINNAVGLMNMRWFLAFLLTTMAACLYGAWLTAKVIAIDMGRRGAWKTSWYEPSSGNIVNLGDKWGLMAKYVLSRYGGAAATGAFLGAAFWIVFGFTVMQLYRVVVGVTTNESWKAKELRAAGGGEALIDGRGYNKGWRRNFAEIIFPKYYLLMALQDKDKHG